ncbi:MAG: ABC transporter ATP-binding protein [Anaerolinea sp.]|nr:ABC transporter ATP-binding protein [Anaerolinea sp.]
MNPLECRDLTKHYGATPVLHGVSLTVRAGAITALLGPSGCGKTTTLRLIAGFEFPDSGTITIKGRVVADSRARIPAEDRRVGMVFQEYALFPHLSVGDNIGFGLKGAAGTKKARIDEMLNLVGLAEMGDRMPHALSGGQQQRVALARALAPQPDILLLDEPFSNLDAALRSQVRADVRTILKAAGMTCVFVTHDQHEALSLADEVAVMFDGRIAQIAPPHVLYHAPVDRNVAAFVGESNFLPGLAEGSSVLCPLGRLPLVEPAHGRVFVLVRPEAVLLGERGINAQVLWREFYGHDQRVGLKLDDGKRIVARTSADAVYEPGEVVGLSVKTPVRALD